MWTHVICDGCFTAEIQTLKTMNEDENTGYAMTTVQALVGAAIVTDLQLSFKYFIELQKGQLLGSPSLQLIIYNGLP